MLRVKTQPLTYTCINSGIVYVIGVDAKVYATTKGLTFFVETGYKPQDLLRKSFVKVNLKYRWVHVE